MPLAGALTLALCAIGCTEEPAPQLVDAEPAPHEWVFIFHVPNDNDLDRHAASIRGSIRRGLIGDRVAATLLIDDADPGGLRRVALTSDSVEEEILDTDDSTDVAVLEAFLEWSSETFPARHYALALLGHGGRLDEVALDLRPEGSTEGNARWASAVAEADAVRRWRASLRSGELELLFLHQCGRATLEGLYSFRDTAPVIIASETFVGAPNSYYRPVLQHLEEEPDLDGAAVARAVLETERHAASLTVLDGRALDELPRRTNALVEALQRPDGRRLARPLGQLSAFGFGGEVTYDLCTYGSELAERNGLSGEGAVSGALGWFRDHLVLARTSRHIFFPRVDDDWCGVATFIPWTPELLEGYGDLPFYRASRWRELLERLAPPSVIPGLPEISPVDPATIDAAGTEP